MFLFFYVSTKVINIFVACHLYFGRNLFSKILFSSKVFFSYLCIPFLEICKSGMTLKNN